MAGEFGIGEDLSDFAFFINDERGTLNPPDLNSIKRSGLEHPIAAAGFHVSIAQEEKGDMVFCDELGMGVERFNTDAKNPCTEFYEFLKMVSEVAYEFDVLRGVVFGIEKEDEGFILKFTERDLIPVARREDKIRCQVIFLQLVCDFRHFLFSNYLFPIFKYNALFTQIKRIFAHSVIFMKNSICKKDLKNYRKVINNLSHFRGVGCNEDKI